MKNIQKITAALLLIAGSSIANAQNWQSGDLLAGFVGGIGATRGVGTEVVFDLGPYNQSPFVSLNDTNGILTSTFGSDWFNNSGVLWTALGSANGIQTAIVPFDQNGLNQTDFSLRTAVRYIAGSINEIYANGTSGVATSTGTQGGFNYYVISGASSVASSLASLDAIAFTGGTSGSFLQSITATTNVVLNTLNADGTYGDYSGLQIVNSGASHGTLQGVPEPSTYALIGFGALLLTIAYRRKKVS